MACSKYTLTNTGSSIANFSYRRCDDNMWEYQVELDPSETKNIWLINGTYSTAFFNSIVLVNQGAFPPLNATATPTPTPTTTPTTTPTPSVTQTQTPTQSGTPDVTPTPTGTPDVTPTPTPTPFFYSFELGSGDTPNAACSATSTSLYTTRSQGPTIETGDELYTDALTTIPAPNGYYSDGTNWYKVDSTVNGIPGEVTTTTLGGCLSLVTPTPTPTQTATNTPTPSITPSATPIARYIHEDLCHSESDADSACGCDQIATIWSNNPVFSASTLFWSDATGTNTGDPNGFYALDNIVYFVNDDCGIGCSTGATLGYSTFCNITPTPTSTQILTPTPTQSGTPSVTPTPTSTPLGTNTFKVSVLSTARAQINNFTINEIPYIVTSGVGFSATTGTFPLAYGNSVYGTHDALNSVSVTFVVQSDGSSAANLDTIINGSTSTIATTSFVAGTNTFTQYVAGPLSPSDDIEFQLY